MSLKSDNTILQVMWEVTTEEAAGEASSSKVSACPLV